MFLILFYSSFIQFKDKKIIVDSNFNNRKYDYGLIVSNFDRKIKNIDKSIQFLKNKKNVILIGKNSNKYNKYGFECVDLIDNKEMIICACKDVMAYGQKYRNCDLYATRFERSGICCISRK